LRRLFTGQELNRIGTAIQNVYIGAGPFALIQLDKALQRADGLKGRSVYQFVNVNAPFPIQVHQLLSWANGEGWIGSLLGAVQQDQPDATELRDLFRSVLATVPAQQALDVAAGAGSLSEAVRAELQRILPGGALVSPDTMQRRIRAVCRVDYADRSQPGEGTGFLVGPDLVLTNYHVVERVIQAPPATEHLRFRFDLSNSTAAADAAGRVVTAVRGQSAVVRSSPPGGVELRNGAGEPTMQQLDYALVRLAERVAEDPVPNGAAGETRACITLKKTMSQPSEDTGLMVLQHPLRGALQFSIGTVIGPNETGSRLMHTAATLNGSSGSPVLDAALAPVALHNGSRPDTPRAEQAFNTAVPLAHIVSDLIQAGVSEMLRE
jgi:hypothetical protein